VISIKCCIVVGGTTEGGIHRGRVHRAGIGSRQTLMGPAEASNYCDLDQYATVVY
jgi:hypothetical protein